MTAGYYDSYYDWDGYDTSESYYDTGAYDDYYSSGSSDDYYSSGSSDLYYDPLTGDIYYIPKDSSYYDTYDTWDYRYTGGYSPSYQCGASDSWLDDIFDSSSSANAYECGYKQGLWDGGSHQPHYIVTIDSSGAGMQVPRLVMFVVLLVNFLMR